MSRLLGAFYKQKKDLTLTPLDGVPSSRTLGIDAPAEDPPSSGPRTRR